MRARVMSIFRDAFFGRNRYLITQGDSKTRFFHEKKSVDDDRIVACGEELDDAIDTFNFQMIISASTT